MVRNSIASSYSLVTILALIICTSSSSLAQDSAPSDDQGTHFKRTNLVVADIDRSLSIYQDILGFTLHGEGISESSEDSYSYPVFKIPQEAKIRFCTMDSEDQVRTMALTEVTGIELPKRDFPHMTAAVIRVKDIHGVMKKIISLGLEVTEPKVAEGSAGRTFTEQAFIDFDGHLIVLYEFI